MKLSGFIQAIKETNNLYEVRVFVFRERWRQDS